MYLFLLINFLQNLHKMIKNHYLIVAYHHLLLHSTNNMIVNPFRKVILGEYLNVALKLLIFE